MYDYIAFLDTETTSTGIYPNENRQIIEIACVVTDRDLTVIEEFLPTAITASEQSLNAMPDEVRQMHEASGLLNRSIKFGTSLETVDNQLVEFLESCGMYSRVIIAGNSVHHDVTAIRQDLPKLYELLHYRVIDVSSISELMKRWRPDAYAARPKKRSLHQAGADVHDTLEELRYYQELMVNNGATLDL